MKVTQQEAAEKLQARKYWGLKNDKLWFDGWASTGHSTTDDELIQYAFKFPSKQVAQDYAKQMNLNGYEAKEL